MPAGVSCKTGHFRNVAGLFSQLYRIQLVKIEFKFESQSGELNKYVSVLMCVQEGIIIIDT